MFGLFSMIAAGLTGHVDEDRGAADHRRQGYKDALREWLGDVPERGHGFADPGADEPDFVPPNRADL